MEIGDRVRVINYNREVANWIWGSLGTIEKDMRFRGGKKEYLVKFDRPVFHPTDKRYYGNNGLLALWLEEGQINLTS